MTPHTDARGVSVISSQDVDVVRGAHEAWNRADLEALRGFYAEDVSATAGTLWPAAGEMVGRDAVLAQFASIFDTFESSVVIAEGFLEPDDGVVVVPSRWRGTLRGSAGVIEQRLAVVYRLQAGLITNIGYFTGLDEALKAAGSQAQAEAPTSARTR